MGWHAEQMKDNAIRWAYESEVCPYHGVRHLEDEPCMVCEDGEEFHSDWWKPYGKYQSKKELS